MEALAPIIERPWPPPGLHQIGYQMEPAMEIAGWLRAVFLDEDGPLFNPDHLHLKDADIACMWTNAEYSDCLMPIAATAEMVRLSGKPWPKARAHDQLCLLFGRVPDFILTFYAPGAMEADDATWCALVEHELYHCVQKKDKEGQPKFDPDNKPVWAIRGHDVEEFIGVMRRYGVKACGENAQEFVAAAAETPLIAAAQIKAVCGTCR